jgi:hypothetical protein
MELHHQHFRPNLHLHVALSVFGPWGSLAAAPGLGQLQTKEVPVSTLLLCLIGAVVGFVTGTGVEAGVVGGLLGSAFIGFLGTQ